MAIQSLTQSVRQPWLATLELAGSSSKGLGLLAEEEEEEEEEDVVPENWASILCRVDFSLCSSPRFRASKPA